MSSFDDTVSDALLEALAFIGETLIVNSYKVLAIVNQISFAEELMDTGGLLHNRGITAVISTPDTLPIVGSSLLYQGLRYRVLEVRQDCVSVELVCATDST